MGLSATGAWRAAASGGVRVRLLGVRVQKNRNKVGSKAIAFRVLCHNAELLRTRVLVPV
jgi:hypothetical protein